MVPPFAKVGDVWHVVVNWMPEMSAADWKLLRPLTPAEAHQLQTHLAHAMFECWAVLVPTDDARTRPRS